MEIYLDENWISEKMSVVHEAEKDPSQQGQNDVLNSGKPSFFCWRKTLYFLATVFLSL